MVNVVRNLLASEGLLGVLNSSNIQIIKCDVEKAYFQYVRGSSFEINHCIKYSSSLEHINTFR